MVFGSKTKGIAIQGDLEVIVSLSNGEVAVRGIEFNPARKEFCNKKVAEGRDAMYIADRLLCNEVAERSMEKVQRVRFPGLVIDKSDSPLFAKTESIMVTSDGVNIGYEG